MKYITLEDVKQNRLDYASAPFDEKNLTTDWLSDGYSLVDVGTTVAERSNRNKTEYMGWIDNVAFQYSVHRNKLTFYGGNSYYWNIIKERVEECTCNTSGLCCIYNRGDAYVEFIFYWELDD